MLPLILCLRILLFLAFGYFRTEPVSPYKSEETPKINLGKFWSYVFLCFNFILSLFVFWSGKILAHYAAEEPSQLVIYFFAEG